MSTSATNATGPKNAAPKTRTIIEELNKRTDLTNSTKSAILHQAFLLVSSFPAVILPEKPVDIGAFCRQGEFQQEAAALVMICELERANLPDIWNAKAEIDELVQAQIEPFLAKERKREFLIVDPLYELPFSSAVA